MKKLKYAYLILILLFLYAPIVILIVFSFNESKSRGVWEGFTLDWYSRLFHDEIIRNALVTTFLCGLLAAIIASAVGTIAAIGLDQKKRGFRNLIISFAYLPMLNAEIVTGGALMLLYTMLNIPLGFVTLLLSHITFCIPYVILSVLPRVKQLDPNMYDVALDLGATPKQTFWKVVLPELLPGIVTGFLLSFTLSIDDFIISFLTTGNGVNNLSITIYTMTKRGINPEINALSTLLFLFILMILITMNMMTNRKNKNSKYTSERESIV